MKKIYTFLALCLLFAACSKEEEKPTPRTYDLAGRVYERYEVSYYHPDQRDYYALEFVNDTSLYKYHGHELLGEDSVWHRQDTIYHSSHVGNPDCPFYYSVTDVSHYKDVWGCVAYIDLYRRTTQTYPINHEHNGETYIYSHHYYTYYISDDENWIWNKDLYYDEYQRVK